MESNDVFDATCARDGIRIPANMQAEVEVELMVLRQHIAIVNSMSKDTQQPSNIFRLDPLKTHERSKMQ
jgi:hypothetical protein